MTRAEHPQRGVPRKAEEGPLSPEELLLRRLAMDAQMDRLGVVKEILLDFAARGFDARWASEMTDDGDDTPGTPLAQCGLSARTLNALEEFGITTLEQLRECHAQDLLAIPNFGPQKLRECQQAVLRSSSK